MVDYPNPYYNGPPLDKGGTCTVFGGRSSPAVRELIGRKEILPDMKVLDFGAGSGRNADWLRDRGVRVFAYDPYHGVQGESGWTGVAGNMNEVNHLDNWDVFLTSFVMNVVPYLEQIKISRLAKRVARKDIHITRNNDLVDMVTKALHRKDKYVYGFYLNDYKGTICCDSDIHDFCMHGTRTSKGFQRLPYMEENGYTLLRKTHSYRIYVR
jgi:hypothetical protein